MMDMREIRRTNGGILAKMAVICLLLSILPWMSAMAETSALEDIRINRQSGDALDIIMSSQVPRRNL
jgi:hypothetical protein